MWWRASAGPSAYSSAMVARVARSSPSIEGLAARAARTGSSGASPSATAPRIAPRERIWRVSWRVSTSATIGTRAPASQSASVPVARQLRSEEHTSELQSLTNLVCRLLLEKKKGYDELVTDDAHYDS